MPRTFIIAEIGQAHDGSLGILHSYIDALADTGVDAIKFQTHIARAESSPYEQFRVPFSYEDATRYDYWKRMEFRPDQWQGIIEHCRDRQVGFISSPFSNEAVDLLESLGVETYKIGSGEVSNLLMLEKIGRTQKKIIVSSGMSSFAELDKAVAFLRPFGSPLSILQCTTQYPTRPEDIGLHLIQELKDRYKLPVGLSDHSGKIFPCLSAVTLGADIVEFHIVFDRRMFGPDSQASVTLDEAKNLVEGIRYTETMRDRHIDKNDISRFKTVKPIFGKSLSVNRDLPAGHRLEFDDLEGKKPAGKGIPADRYQAVLGKQLKRNLLQWDFLNEDDIDE